MLINYADLIMMTQPKFTSTILIPQTLIDKRKAPHRRARSVLPNPLNDMYCVIIQGMWKHTFYYLDLDMITRDYSTYFLFIHSRND